MARAGLVAPAAQAQPAQLATGACAEGGLLGAVEPLAVAVLGGLPGGAVGGAFLILGPLYQRTKSYTTARATQHTPHVPVKDMWASEI